MTRGETAGAKVLVVDDDPALAEMLGIVLRAEGWTPAFVADGARALAAFRDTHPDLVLLDLMLPGRDGIDVCRDIRAESGVPIVMLTARGDTTDVVRGLETGADDYVVKPFKPAELVARVRARLRARPDANAEPEVVHIGPVEIDVPGHVVTRDGHAIALTPLEFDLLVALARRPGAVFTRQVLLEQVWGYKHVADTRLVNVHVQRLRAKVERDPEHPEVVLTVRGVGYKAGSCGRLGRRGVTSPAGAHRVRAGLTRARGWPVRRWHRSLRVRVVATTLALAAVVVTVLGVVLSEQVGRSLVDAQRRQALAEVDAGLATAQKILHSSNDPSTALPQVDVALNPIASGAAAFEVLLLPTDATHAIAYVPIGLLGVQASGIPASLRREVLKQQEAYAYTDVTGASGGSRAVLVVGAPLSPLTGTSYEMYYVFPLDQVKSTLGHIRTRLLEGGLALVVLLMVVAAIVARQVVTPVRLAARTASRFAAGQLAERMDTRGGDDLAQLATAFNDMAGALQQQIARLEDLSRVQRRFTADVSHELRTPLTTVRMAADVLYDGRDSYPPAVARSAELLQSELNRFEGLLADLLEISRYDANAAVLEVEPVDVVELVRGVVDGAAALAAGRGTTIDVSDVPREPVLAEVDPRRVSRILRNLVTNAVEYSEGRPVEISLRADDVAVAVRVRDHGPGLRPGDATRVFDRFWRADPSRARNTGGTGLGLSIALEDARLHGGWLGAWGRPGQGAAFRLVLPRASGQPVLTAPMPLEDAPQDGPRDPVAAR